MWRGPAPRPGQHHVPRLLRRLIRTCAHGRQVLKAAAVQWMRPWTTSVERQRQCSAAERWEGRCGGLPFTDLSPAGS